jgi:hypothetical protein
MFLWLTQDLQGEPRFMSFVSPQSLLGMEQRGLVPAMPNATTAESFDEYLQAGTDGILVAHNSRAVYYSQYVNQTFVDFIESNDFTDPVKVRAMKPTTEFPITGTKGTLELKASWMIVEDNDDVSTMFTTTTRIAKLVNDSGQISIDPGQTEEVEVALVGFHIGGIVDAHPEMIWATFEHIGNSPVIPTTPNPFPLDDPVSEKDFTFYTANTIAGECNINPASSNQRILDDATQKLTPITQVCLQYENGNALGVNPDNDQHIKSLNSSVHGNLSRNSSDVWVNYREVGAIWFGVRNGLVPGMKLATDKNLTGSLKLSNSTIETFTQRASTHDNCFRCHNTAAEIPLSSDLLPLKATNLNISHAFQNIYFWSQQSEQ